MSEPIPQPAKDQSLFILGGAFALTAMGDFLLWPARPGFSLGLFIVAAAAALLWRQPLLLMKRRVAVAAALLLATAIQTAIELSFSNVLTSVLLLFFLQGEARFPQLPSACAKAVETALAIFRSPGRWFQLPQVFARLPIGSLRLRKSLIFLARVVAPVVAITMVFGLLLAEGNAILGEGLTHLFRRLIDILQELDFSLWHCIFLGSLATFALALVSPAGAWLPERLWRWQVPALPAGKDLRLAHWRSWAILAALNALFFAANTIDAAYLWVSHRLPLKVSYSQYVHEGVATLSVTVVLSAILLTGLSQQTPAITKARLFRALAGGWIVQNLVLIASVMLRLKLYMDAFELSCLRVYVAFFLLLVTAGFLLLAWRIAQEKSLGWLISRNILATFTLFAAVQFLDVERWVADFNVAECLQKPEKSLDLSYLESLGANAYPALLRLVEAPSNRFSADASEVARVGKERERLRLSSLNWRSRQFRPDGRAAELLAHHFIGEPAQPAGGR